MKLDPLSIPDLARSMAEEDWLDMRVVDYGLLSRVRVTCILIYREDESVELTQEYLADDSQAVEAVKVVVPAENVWWARPTQFELADVDPMRPRTVTPPIMDTGKVVAAACQAVAENINMALDLFLQLFNEKPHRGAGTHPPAVRHQVMWIVYEMTDLSNVECCKACGWRSPQPWVSARQRYFTVAGRMYVARKEYVSLFKQLVARARVVGGEQWTPSEPKYLSLVEWDGLTA